MPVRKTGEPENRGAGEPGGGTTDAGKGRALERSAGSPASRLTGSPRARGRTSIQKGDFSADAELARLISGRVGGTVMFIGSVRGSSPKGKVTHLEFQSYGPMAQEALERIRRQAMRRFPVEDIIIIHRTGRINARGHVVLIAAAAAHRDAAFLACRFALEELKRSVPIWKKERGNWSLGDRRAAPARPRRRRRS